MPFLRGKQVFEVSSENTKGDKPGTLIFSWYTFCLPALASSSSFIACKCCKFEIWLVARSLQLLSNVAKPSLALQQKSDLPCSSHYVFFE